jgi:hypothetical protein
VPLTAPTWPTGLEPSRSCACNISIDLPIHSQHALRSIRN